MLRVVFSEDSRGRLSSVCALGHAEFAVDGDDLVCAAVSAVLQAARLGLEHYAGVDLQARQKSGEFFIAWPADRRADAGVLAIVATAELAVRQIARQYPEHVTVVRENEKSPPCNTANERG